LQRTTIAAITRGFFLSVILIVTAWGETTPPGVARPRSINYVEREVSIEGSPLNAGAIGALELERNQSIATQAGRAEILLTPRVFLRLADESTLKMISPDLASTELRLERGRALVEIVDIHKENDIRIDQNGAETRLLKEGLYDFDAEHNEVRVFNGPAQVNVGDRKVMLGGSQKVALNGATPRASHIQVRQYRDGFYRWSRLRSAFLSEASVSAARSYLGVGPGVYWSRLVRLGLVLESLVRSLYIPPAGRNCLRSVWLGLLFTDRGVLVPIRILRQLSTPLWPIPLSVWARTSAADQKRRPTRYLTLKRFYGHHERNDYAANGERTDRRK
jgi:hypothetical protein